MSLLMGVFLLGIVIASTVIYSAINTVQVNGPIYKRVVQGKDLVADILPPPEYLLESYLVSLEMMRADVSALPPLLEKSRQLRKDFEERHQFWKNDLPEGKIKSLMMSDAYTPGMAFLDLLDNQLVPALQAGDRRTAEEVLVRMDKKYAEHRAVIDELVTLTDAENSAGEKDAAAVINGKWMLLGVLVSGITLLVVMLGLAILRNVNGLLGGDPRYARDITKHVASGNLGMQVDIAAHDTSSLLASIKNMQEVFRRMVKESQESANLVAASAQQMATASDQVSVTSQHSSASTATMAASTEQVTASMSQVIASAREAHEISVQSEKSCANGVQVIQQAVQSMEKIAATVRDATEVVLALDSQSEQISSVVQVIREIADQTNLLALNAAIEAARAGEQGRGFAVVADEVRKLAERTTRSTAEIANMIGSIQTGMRSVVGNMEAGVQQVSEGVEHAGDAGNAIRQIQDGAQRVVQVVSDMSKALNEQGVASEHISHQVEQIARMAEENNAVAQETSHGAHELLNTAMLMQSTVNRFAV
jgi:methyl-accepting chemotaxis protein